MLVDVDHRLQLYGKWLYGGGSTMATTMDGGFGDVAAPCDVLLPVRLSGAWWQQAILLLLVHVNGGNSLQPQEWLRWS